MLVLLERNLSPEQVDSRLRQAHRARRTAERALAFYLKEVNDRRLFEAFGNEGSHCPSFAAHFADFGRRGA